MDISTMDYETAEAVERLRLRVGDLLKPHHGDAFLLRWLKLRNFDVKKTEKMLRHCLLVRETYQLDTIAENYKKPEVCEKYEFIGFLGFDKDSTPIRYVAIGKGDYNGFLHSLNTVDICVYCAAIIEQDLAATRHHLAKTGQKKNHEDLLVIFDFADFSLHNLAYRHIIETGLDLMRLFQDLHPDLIKRVIIINAPIYFYAIFKIFKPILRHTLIQRIQVCSKESTPSELLKYIDADVLPCFLGGKRVDKNGDTFCSAFIKNGGTIPESYYAPTNLESFLNPEDPGVHTKVVGARSTFDKSIQADFPKKVFRLQYWSDGNIGLRVLYLPAGTEGNNWRDCEGDCELISPHATIQSNIVPLDYLFTCPRAGTYIFRFDNTYSWMQSKKIVYRFEEIR